MKMYETPERTDNGTGTATPEPKKRFGCLQVTLIVLAIVAVTLLVSGLAVKAYLFPSEFKPVTLTAGEEQQLTRKMERIEDAGITALGRDRPLSPEKYTEEGADRQIVLTEREVNALIAKNTDLAGRLAIDFSDDLVSARMRVPLDEDFPVLGGKTIRVKAGLHLAYSEGRPEVILRGVSVMGVPLPNAWLGGIKNTDLVREFGAEEGFWKAFADGVEDIRTEEGLLKVTLKE